MTWRACEAFSSFDSLWLASGGILNGIEDASSCWYDVEWTRLVVARTSAPCRVFLSGSERTLVKCQFCAFSASSLYKYNKITVVVSWLRYFLNYPLEAFPENQLELSTMSVVLTGGCQCGQVKYSSTILPNDFTNCHCQTCRRLSGAAFLTFAHFPVSAINWISGPASLKRTHYSDEAERTHCPECGSHISMQYNCQPDRISITAGSIYEDSVKGSLPKVKDHIFVESGSKAGWYDLPDDGVPRFSKFSGGFQSKIDQWKKVPSGPGLG